MIAACVLSVNLFFHNNGIGSHLLSWYIVTETGVIYRDYKLRQIFFASLLYLSFALRHRRKLVTILQLLIASQN